MEQYYRSLYLDRRNRIAAELPEDALFILAGATTRVRNADIEYPFRQESNFLYLTGWKYPDAVLVIHGGKTPQSTIFYKTQSAQERLFCGSTPSKKDLVKDYGLDDAFPLRQLTTILRNTLGEKNTLYYPKDGREPPAELNATILAQQSHLAIEDAIPILTRMGLIKNTMEVDTMRRAAKVSAAAHLHLMKITRPGMYERDLVAALSYDFIRGGGDPLHAYPSIVASGKNACTLHYTECECILIHDDLVLVDAGCEIDGYASDITRTFPVNGKFNKAQRILYEIVLRAQKEAINLVRPGVTLPEVHKIAEYIIAQGLIENGILHAKSPEDVIESGSVNRFFPHRTSHWLGLDVHDVGIYDKKEQVTERGRLAAGMVITVEPGIYIPAKARGVEPMWRDIGIRIEDDILVTEKGNEVLSADAPKEIADIECIMRHTRT